MQACALRRLSCAFSLAVVLGAGPMTRAADLRPSWECLPEGTAVMVRLPRPAQALDEIRDRTKFGAVVLGPERLRKAWALAVESMGGEDGTPRSVEDLEERLAKYGLGPADMEAAFAGDMGMAIVLHRRDGKPPLAMSLAWLEPGAESAERMVAAFERQLEEDRDSEAPPQRVDVEMAGYPVICVSRALLQADLGTVKVEGQLDAESRKKFREELAERARNAPKVTVGTQQFFLTRSGGRLLLGQTLPQARMPRVKTEALDNGLELKIETEAAAGESGASAEDARAVFERFLAAHAASAGGPVPDVLRAPGMRDALPGGDTIVEVVVDPRPFLNTFLGDDPEAVRRVVAVGLGDVGPIGLRWSFEAGRLRQGIFATLPAPRAGLFHILDQDCDAAEVPSFVTREAVDFTQISLDLAGVYRTVKEFAVMQFAEQAANLFTTIETQGQVVLGVDVEKMLANLGTRHWIVTYPSQIAAAVQARRDRDAAGGGQAASAERIAFVWKLDDDTLVRALVPKIAGPLQAQVVEEQGFQGFRTEAGASVFVGQGHLVVAMGGDSLEKTLAGIRNPPAGAASLREGDVPRKAADLLALGPCRMFSMSDATRTGGMLGEVRDVMTAMVPDDVEERYRDLLKNAQALLPQTEEMQGMFGVGATIMEVNDAGVAIKSAWEMPAP